MLSQHFINRVKETYADSHVSPSEIIRLRNDIHHAEAHLLDQEGYHGTLSALFKSFDVTGQLLQEFLLQMRRDQHSDLGREMVKSALEANMVFLKTSLDAFWRD